VGGVGGEDVGGCATVATGGIAPLLPPHPVIVRKTRKMVVKRMYDLSGDKMSKFIPMRLNREGFYSITTIQAVMLTDGGFCRKGLC
jgi:hypothetical protein